LLRSYSPQPALAPLPATIWRVADQTTSSNPGRSRLRTMPRSIGRRRDALRPALGIHLVIPKRFADAFGIIHPVDSSALPNQITSSPAATSAPLPATPQSASLGDRVPREPAVLAAAPLAAKRRELYQHRRNVPCHGNKRFAGPDREGSTHQDGRVASHAVSPKFGQAVAYRGWLAWSRHSCRRTSKCIMVLPPHSNP
jgi:hypothetical protein